MHRFMILLVFRSLQWFALLDSLTHDIFLFAEKVYMKMKNLISIKDSLLLYWSLRFDLVIVKLKSCLVADNAIC